MNMRIEDIEYMTFESRVGSGAYVAVHRATCGHLRKHGGPPERDPRYVYTGFRTLQQAVAYANRTELEVRECRCL